MHAFHKVDLVPVSLRFSYYLVYFSVKYNFDDTAIKSIQQLVTVRVGYSEGASIFFQDGTHLWITSLSCFTAIAIFLSQLKTISLIIIKVAVIQLISHLLD